jgi:hypothetical protein
MDNGALALLLRQPLVDLQGFALIANDIKSLKILIKNNYSKLPSP